MMNRHRPVQTKKLAAAVALFLGSVLAWSIAPSGERRAVASGPVCLVNQ